MRKSSIFMTGMLALLLAFGLVLGGCPNGNDDDDDDGGINSKLLGEWSRGEGGAGNSFVITSDGEFQAAIMTYKVTEDAGTITLSFGGQTVGTADWSVSDDGNTLTLTNGTGALFQDLAKAGSNTYTKQ
jgi:hypothetical protein